MVTAELNSSQILNPFIVFTGSTGFTYDPNAEDAESEIVRKRPHLARLSNQYKDWEGIATIMFQKKHWFDVHITIAWLKWLKAQYNRPGVKIGLIWDKAPSQKESCTMVQDWIEKNKDWLVVELIPGGMTSILQVCDLTCNAVLKRKLKSKYYAWRVKEVRRLKELHKDKVHFKLKIPRGDLTKIIEEVFKEYNQDELTQNTASTSGHYKSIERTFNKVGQNPWNDDLSKFNAFLADLSKDSMYKALLANQTAADLDPNMHQS